MKIYKTTNGGAVIETPSGFFQSAPQGKYFAKNSITKPDYVDIYDGASVAFSAKFDAIEKTDGSLCSSVQDAVEYLADVFASEGGGGGSVLPDSFILVESLADLPAPVDGEIILPANGDFYVFLRVVDLGGDTLIPNNNTLMGSSQETGGIANAYIEINQTCPIKFMRFDNCNIVINAPTGAFDWESLNFYNTNGRTINIQAAQNCVFKTFGFINSLGPAISGTLDSFIMTDSIIRNVAALDYFVYFTDATVINRRVRIEDSVFATSDPLQVGIFVEVGAQISLESFLCEDLRFTGTGTPLNGINGNDDRALFRNCIGMGVINTAVKGYVYMKNNTAPTTVSAINARYEVAGTKTLDTAFAQRFSLVSNRLQYTSDVPRQVSIQLTGTLTAASNNVIGTYIAINRNGNPIDPTADRISESEMYTTTSGTRPETVNCQCIATLSKDDKIYVVTQNTSAINDVTYSFLNFIVKEV